MMWEKRFYAHDHEKRHKGYRMTRHEIIRLKAHDENTATGKLALSAGGDDICLRTRGGCYVRRRRGKQMLTGKRRKLRKRPLVKIFGAVVDHTCYKQNKQSKKHKGLPVTLRCYHDDHIGGEDRLAPRRTFLHISFLNLSTPTQYFQSLPSVPGCSARSSPAPPRALGCAW